MGNYRHGIYTREVPTSLISMTEATAALPVFVGTAPVHLATDAAEANKAVLHLQLLNLGTLKNGINILCAKLCTPSSLYLEWRQ